MPCHSAKIVQERFNVGVDLASKIPSSQSDPVSSMEEVRFIEAPPQNLQGLEDLMLTSVVPHQQSVDKEGLQAHPNLESS